MRGIKLKDSIKMFGFKDAFSFWFKWSFIEPIEQWIWLNVTHKPYCAYHGYACESLSTNEECTYPKLTKKEDILKHWAEDEKEISHVEAGKDGKCLYCGEFPGKVLIPDPNGGLGSWKICLTCKKIIDAQQNLSFAALMSEKEKDEKSKVFWNNEARKAKEQLDFIAAESFMKPITITIKKNGEEGR
jgi:hypothetical protein